jgi:hypothetical protein
MRPVNGFDRPGLQWLFVALGAGLIVIAADEAIGLHRAQQSVAALRVADLNARTDRRQLETRLAQEQSARESFALEVNRLRDKVSAGSAPEATLTLSPIIVRGAIPPEATVAAAPPPAQSIQLRLVLPSRRADETKRYAMALRSWSNGMLLWSRSGLRAATVDSRAAVTARVTGDVLIPGSYEIALTDVTSDASSREVAFYEITIGHAGS